MEWDDLKHFLAVARSGSLTEAARDLKTSAATVGRRVTALEAKLGARLFDRQQTGYTLTESGEAIRLKAESVEEAVLAVEREALGRDLQATGKVRLAASDDVAAHVLAPHLGEFRRSYPGISLEIVARMDQVNLTRREADIAVRGMRPTEGDFVVRRAGSWPFALYAAKTYARAHQLRPGKIDFSRAEIITWTEEWTHLRGGPWFAKYAPQAKIALASDSRRVHQSACKAGIGLAILPCHLSDCDPDLVQLLVPAEVLSVELWIVVHRDLVHTARVRAVMDFLGDIIPKYGP
jgi:DNA-binding transcriptional LysR family regulator